MINLITLASLKTQTLKNLTELAKSRGVSGWHSMRKEQLVKALARTAKPKPAKAKPAAPAARLKAASSPQPSRRTATKVTAGRAAVRANGSNGSTSANGTNGSAKLHAKPASRVRPTTPRAVERIHKVHAERERLKDLSGALLAETNGSGRKKSKVADKDRLVLMVRDSFWLHASWSVTRQSVKRAEAALAEHWHTARPILRLLQVDAGQTTSTSERIVREIEVHGGVTNWYIDVSTPPESFRVELGYKSGNGKFYALSRSNAVTTPAPDSSDAIDENWTDIAENYERVYAMSGGYAEDNQSGELQEIFEERLRRPMGSPLGSQFGSGAERVLNRHRDFRFQVDAEMIIYGSTKPDAHVSLAGEPVKLRPDGTFTIRLSMPDRRQVLPVVASSADGIEQRTIVIAVERNTKVLEPMLREAND